MHRSSSRARAYLVGFGVNTFAVLLGCAVHAFYYDLQLMDLWSIMIGTMYGLVGWARREGHLRETDPVGATGGERA